MRKFFYLLLTTIGWFFLLLGPLGTLTQQLIIKTFTAGTSIIFLIACLCEGIVFLILGTSLKPIQPRRRRRRASQKFNLIRSIRVCVFQKYATFRGQATLSEYWWFWGAYLLLISLSSISMMLWSDFMPPYDKAPVYCVIIEFTLMLVFTFCLFGFLCPFLAVSVRRLHDTGLSGWHILWTFIPYGIGFIIHLVLMTQPTKRQVDETESTIPKNPTTPPPYHSIYLRAKQENNSSQVSPEVVRTEEQREELHVHNANTDIIKTEEQHKEVHECKANTPSDNVAPNRSADIFKKLGLTILILFLTFLGCFTQYYIPFYLIIGIYYICLVWKKGPRQTEDYLMLPLLQKIGLYKDITTPYILKRKLLLFFALIIGTILWSIFSISLIDSDFDCDNPEIVPVMLVISGLIWVMFFFYEYGSQWLRKDTTKNTH